MKAFTDLYLELDASTRTNAKLAALKRYFAEAPDEDAAWAVYFLTGQRLKRVVKASDLRALAGEACGFPLWMIEACYDQVGDLAETLALLLANRPQQGTSPRDQGLAETIETRLLPLRGRDREAQRAHLLEAWAGLDGASSFIFNKLLTGGFRVGVNKTLVTRALAELAGVEPASMAHRLMGHWEPNAADYGRLFADQGLREDPARPYPFCLAYPLEEYGFKSLGPVENWHIEWKWDGIRAQLIKRGETILLWSRGEELVGGQFPEIIASASTWPEQVVLDGEVLAWEVERAAPMPFAALQRRLGRKQVGPKLRREVPVTFMAYDLLEIDGRDLRGMPTVARRQQLKQFAASPRGHFQISPLIEVSNWDAVADLRAQSRERGVEGLMLKSLNAPYFAGRRKGEWWKWKVEPHTIDAVMVYAQQGHGRRAGLYTDYTFAIWQESALVPFAKAYSGLSDAEIREVDRWIRQHTRESHGPVRVVDPELVFEIAFEGVSASKRHKSGIAVRFPRILRWRRNKPAAEADSLETVSALLDASREAE